MNTPTPCLSFIGIVDFSQEAKWLFMTESVTELLGYEPHELIGRPSLELVHPDEFPRVKQLHYDTIQQDKAAVLVYLRMKHKDRFKGYVLCGVSRTVVHNVLVGSVSFASPGAKALQNASTAQEITVISPVASNFEFRRWHDPSPMPPSPIPPSMAIPQALPMAMALPASPSPSASSWSSSRSPRGSSSPLSPGLGGLRHRSDSGGSASSGRRSRASSRSSLSVSPERRAHTSHIRRGSGGGESNTNTNTNTNTTTTTTTTAGSTRARGDSNAVPIISFPHLSNKSFRTALILDRFSAHCTIMYCSNDLLISSSDAIGCSFYDFVDAPDEVIVRDWINTVKGWGVNEKGQPSDGGFGFGKFCLITERRDSIERMPDPPSPSRNRRASTSRGANASANSRAGRHAHHRGQHHTAASRTAPALTARSAARTSARPQSQSPPQEHARLGLGLGTSQAQCEKFKVDAIFSAHSDGLMVILRRA